MSKDAIESVKRRIAQEIRNLHPRLIEISHEIHAHPELLFEERFAAALLAGELEKEGFSVQRGVAGMETAFVGSFGQGKPKVGFMAEYDALPQIGHACGHNLIAVWALGAGLALKRALPELQGTIQVIGTPAEEGGGGKVILGDEGVFRGMDTILMIHPLDISYPTRPLLGIKSCKVEFFGQSAHASASPDKGINALDALLQVFFSLNAMRQMVKSTCRIHGCITHGGVAPNIIPDYSCGQFMLRAMDQDYLEELDRRFRNIVEAAALATGARFEITPGICYGAMASNPTLVDLVQQNMTELDIEYEVSTATDGIGSSDVGNVSQLVPTLQPYLQICPRGIAIHSPRFTEFAAGEQADRAIASGCNLLARVAAEVLLDPETRQKVRAAFKEQTGRDPQE